VTTTSECCVACAAGQLLIPSTRAADEVDDRQHDRHFRQHADVESAAPDWKPKRAIAAATASLRQLLAVGRFERVDLETRAAEPRLGLIDRNLVGLRIDLE
jgi:hypothetical protein